MIGGDRFVDKLDEPSQKLHAMQRYRDGISDVDMWNFDSFLADAIVFACDWYIGRGETSPFHLETSQWHEVLGKIRDGFTRPSDGDFAEPSAEVWELLASHFKYMWD